jgi:hypothetical protein
MSQLPTTKPGTDLSWASSGGTKTSPSPGQQTDGWTLGDQMLKGNHNWLWDAFERFLTWIFSVIPRSFDDLVEAIDTVPAGSVFMLEITQDFTDAIQSKPSKHGTAYPITFLETDGRRLYYVQNDELIAATCRPGLTADVEWSIDISALGENMGVPTALSTDGRIVMLVTAQAAAENTALMVNAATGAVLRKTNTIGGWTDVVADSTSAGPEAYLVNNSTVNTIYNMTDLAGPATWVNLGTGGTLDSVTTTPTDVIAANGGGGFYVATKVLTPALVYNFLLTSGRINVISDGLSLITTAFGGFIEMTGPHGGRSFNSSGLTLPAVPADIDDAYVYQRDDDDLVALSKADLSTIHTWANIGAVASSVIASSGQYLWTNTDSGDALLGHLNALPIARSPQYWVRLDGGASGSLGLIYPQAMRALAAPIARDLI